MAFAAIVRFHVYVQAGKLAKGVGGYAQLFSGGVKGNQGVLLDPDHAPEERVVPMSVEAEAHGHVPLEYASSLLFCLLHGPLLDDFVAESIDKVLLVPV